MNHICDTCGREALPEKIGRRCFAVAKVGLCRGTIVAVDVPATPLPAVIAHFQQPPLWVKCNKCGVSDIGEVDDPCGRPSRGGFPCKGKMVAK
jgi:hypothetical protein